MSGQKQIWQQLELENFGEFNNNLISKIHIPLQHIRFTSQEPSFFSGRFHPQIGCASTFQNTGSLVPRYFGEHQCWQPKPGLQNPKANPGCAVITHLSGGMCENFYTVGTHLTFIFDFLGYKRVTTVIYYIFPCFLGSQGCIVHTLPPKQNFKMDITTMPFQMKFYVRTSFLHAL